MTFFKKAGTLHFWGKVLQIATVFFCILVILSLLFHSYSALFKLDWQAVADENFNGGKWIWFFISKIVVSLVYGIWVTARNLR